jgi:hypothetical protein
LPNALAHGKFTWYLEGSSQSWAGDWFAAIDLAGLMPGWGRPPAYANSGWPAPQLMKLGRQKAGTRQRLLALHCCRSNPRIG